MTVSTPPTPTPEPGNIAIVATIVGGLILGVYRAFKAIRDSLKTEKAKNKEPDPAAPSAESAPAAITADDPIIKNLKAEVDALREEMTGRMDEIDARVDYVRRLAQQTDRTVQARNRHDAEAQDSAGNEPDSANPISADPDRGG